MALRISLGVSLSIGTDLPRRFQMSMLPRCSGFQPRQPYTSLKRCRQEARSSSRLTYSTLPCAQSKPSQLLPSAIAMVSSISANDLPALDGPASSILCPCRSTPPMSAGASGGISSQTALMLSGSGKSSVALSMNSRHSAKSALPMLVSMRNCLCPFRITPGIRDRRDGLRFCWSSSRPFLRQTVYRYSTRLRYSG